MSNRRKRSGFPAGMREELQRAEQERSRRAQEAEKLSDKERQAKRDEVVQTAVMNIDMDVPEQAHAQAQAHAPKGRENMVRSHFHLRPDQIEFLDGLAEASGKGVYRSDWVRFAIDRLMLEMEDRAGETTKQGSTKKP